MSTPSNRVPYQEIRLSHAAGWLLHGMDIPIGNVPCLGDALALVGLALSHSDLNALIDRLETAGFITTELVTVGPLATRRADLLRNGRELLQRRARCDWIIIPE